MTAPIVRSRSDDGEVSREIELARWGLRPNWSKPGMPAPINARLESVAEKPMFKAAFSSQRCLVPMDPGYYEWTQEVDGKQPHLVHGDGGLLAAAGLFASRKVDEAWEVSFTIVTRAAVDSAGKVHERMPVFVASALWDDWLDPVKLADVDGTLEMLQLSSAAIASALTTYPVARKLNNTRTVDQYDPLLVEPVDVGLGR